jgi:hypothetical protein
MTTGNRKDVLMDIVINSFFSLVIGAKIPFTHCPNLMILKEIRLLFLFSKKGMWWVGLLAAAATAAYIILEKSKSGPKSQNQRSFSNILQQKPMISSS